MKSKIGTTILESTLMICNQGLKNGWVFGSVILILGIQSKEIFTVNTRILITVMFLISEN